MKKTNYIAKKPNKSGLIDYSDAENQTWKTLYERQIKLIKNRAATPFIEGIKALKLNAKKIPQCKEVSDILQDLTGWSVTPVEALISFQDFFQLLASKQFPAASFIRIPEELDYLKEPDIFHELFGHGPMLTNSAFANFTQQVGQFGLKANKQERAMLARLYWFTVEFGLLQTDTGLRIYGGGILSSKTESVYALESDAPKRLPFNLLTVLRTPYRYDELQKTYFIIDHIDTLYNLLSENLLDAFHQARKLGMLEPEELDELRSC